MAPFNTVVINSNIKSEGSEGRLIVAPGYYLLEAADITVSSEKHNTTPGKFPGLYWRLKIKEGPEGHGRAFRYHTTLSPEGLFNLGNVLFYLGVPDLQDKLVEKKIDSQERLEQLAAFILKNSKGRQLVALVADGTYDSKPTSDIVQMFKPQEYEELSSSVVPSRSARSSGSNGSVPSTVEIPETGFDEDEKVETVEEKPKRTRAPRKEQAPAEEPATEEKNVEKELDSYFDE